MKLLFIAFTTLLMLACTSHESNFQSTGILLNTSIKYDPNKWEIVANSVENGGGRNYAIKSKQYSIAVAITERPDNTKLIDPMVLLSQLESGQQKSFFKFEVISPNSNKKMIKYPDGWVCKSYEAQKTERGISQYYTNCVRLADTAWANLIVLTPIQASTEEIDLLNKTLLTINFNRSSKKP